MFRNDLKGRCFNSDVQGFQQNQDFSKNPRFQQKPKILAKTQDFSENPRFQQKPKILAKTQYLSQNSRFQPKPKILAKTQDFSESHFALNLRKTQFWTFFGWKNLKSKKFIFIFCNQGVFWSTFMGYVMSKKSQLRQKRFFNVFPHAVHL